MATDLASPVLEVGDWVASDLHKLQGEVIQVGKRQIRVRIRLGGVREGEIGSFWFKKAAFRIVRKWLSSADVKWLSEADSTARPAPRRPK